jgi:hypothetical protein
MTSANEMCHRGFAYQVTKDSGQTVFGHVLRSGFVLCRIMLVCKTVQFF